MELLGIVFVVACGLLMLALGVYGLAPTLFTRRVPRPGQPPAADPRVDALVAEVEALRLTVEDMSRALSSLRGEASGSSGAPDPPGLLHAS